MFMQYGSDLLAGMSLLCLMYTICFAGLAISIMFWNIVGWLCLVLTVGFFRSLKSGTLIIDSVRQAKLSNGMESTLSGYL